MNNLENLTDRQLLDYYQKCKEASDRSKRFQDRKRHGFDTKFSYHVVRLLLQGEQILMTGDLDLRAHSEQLKSIRRGEWTEQEIREWAASKEADLEKVYVESKLRHKPDEEAIKKLLVECLEHHYGNLSDAIVIQDRTVEVLRNIQAELDRVRHLI